MKEGLHLASCQIVSTERLHSNREMFQHDVLDALRDVTMLELRVLACSQLDVVNPGTNASAHVHRGWSAKR